MSRFIWQFDLTNQQWLPQGNWQKGPYKWEVRYFWPVEQIIRLNINESQLNWSQAVCKTHLDNYLIDKDNPLNIKERHNKLVCKPFVSQQSQRIAYNKKVNLTADELTPDNLLTVPIEKMAIQFIVHRKPKCVLELSKIQLLNQTFTSLCIESRCGELLDDLHHHLKLPGKASSYLDFLCEKLNTK